MNFVEMSVFLDLLNLGNLPLEFDGYGCLVEWFAVRSGWTWKQGR